jgi:hypothetical protein
MTEMKLLHILAGLNGLLKKVHDLGMPMVSVNQVEFNETHLEKESKQ